MFNNNYFPQLVGLELTNACNLQCLHCECSSGKCHPDELTISELKSVIDELVRMKAELFCLTGGEPLMRPDWQEIARHIQALGARCCLGTNGTLITPELLEDCLEAGVTGIGTSIDGMETMHDFIRGRPGAWRRTTDAIRLICKRSEFSVAVATTVSRLNLGELEEIFEHVCSVGCNRWRVQLANPVGRMEEHREQLLTDQEFEALIDQILALKKSSPIEITVANNIGHYGNKGAALWKGTPFVGDYSGLRAVGITASGDVKGELSLPDQFIEGNIRESSIADIWTSDKTFTYNREFSMEMVGGFCQQCRYLPLCRGGSAVSSFVANGIRANAPYCMHRIEQARGEEPIDSSMTRQLLATYGQALPRAV